MTCAPCFAASSMCLRWRSTIESLLPVQAVWTSAAFTFAIPTSPPSRLRRLAQLLREADELGGRERAGELVLHPVGDPGDRVWLARGIRIEYRAMRATDQDGRALSGGEQRAVRRVRIFDDDHASPVGEGVRIPEAVAHLHARETGGTGELEPRLERSERARQLDRLHP